MSARSLAAFGPLSRAEQTLVDGLDAGDFDRLGDGAAPQAGDADRAVRAALLRFLILGGPDAPRQHEKGIRLSGAWITGALDLEGCRAPHDIGLADCRFEAAPVLRAARIDTLFLDGSILPGLVADRLEARGGVYLRAAAVDGAVVLTGARLGGELVCDGALMSQPDGLALDAARLRTGGGVLLRGATVRGGVMLADARLGADLDMVGAAIERPGAIAVNASGGDIEGDFALRVATVRGEIRMKNARVSGDCDLSGGSFEEEGGAAITLNRSIIAGAFIMRDKTAIRGALSLNGAALGAIVDDPQSWPGPGDLLLNRCIYGGFLAAPVDGRTRIRWLSRQDPARWGEDFWPQPYEHLAGVLQEMGHGEDARRVLIAKERLQRRARRARARWGAVRLALWLKDALLAITIRYGREPLLAFVWLGLFWTSGAALFATIEAREALRPNAPVFLRAPEWTLCGVPAAQTLAMPSLGQTRAGLAAPGQSQLACFLAQPEAASFPKFNPWMYALDAVLPALETGQQDYWAPDTRTAWGYAGKAFGYFLTLAGWALSLLAVAGFSGIVKSK